MIAALHIARADFFERTRQYQYLLLIVATLVLGVWFVPTRAANYSTFVIDNYEGIYNSAWMGALFAAFIALFVSLFGFYCIKSTVERDRQTRVGEIIAATPVGKLAYIGGKTLSNFAVLLSVAAILFFDAVLMQFVRGESHTLNLVAIVNPFLVIALPTLAVVAAIAVLFEVLPVLRGGIGNVVYFVLWMVLLMTASGPGGLNRPSWMDIFGVNVIARNVAATLPPTKLHGKFHATAMITSGGPSIHRFVFDGFNWTGSEIAQRVALLAVALTIVALSALLFDRFASTVRQRSSRTFAPLARFESALEGLSTPLLNLVCHSDMGSLVLAEFRLLVNGLGFWWYAVALGLWTGSLFATGTGQTVLLALAWVWAILIWSQMGTRESVNATEQLIYPSLHPLRRQFFAQWCAGVVLALALASGAVIHHLAAGYPHALLGIVVGAIFLPSLALACGALSGTTRAFEILYLVLWYCGPMNNNPNLDYTGTFAAPAFAVATIALLAIAFLARRRRLQQA